MGGKSEGINVWIPRGMPVKEGDMPAREVSDQKPSVEQRMVYQARLQEVRDAISLSVAPGSSGQRF